MNPRGTRAWALLWDRTAGTLAWKFESRAAARLYSFALAEHESMLELRLAANLTTHAPRVALYLRHANDEANHARMFFKRANELRKALGASPYPFPRTDHSHWFRTYGEEGFLTLVYDGERRGREQFETFAAFFSGRNNRKMATLFTRILQDEERHECYTRELLQKPSSRARWSRRFTRMRSLGEPLTKPVFTLAVTCLFFLAAPLSLPIRWLARPRPGWSKPGA